MAEPLSLNFRVFTVKLVGVRKFRNFTVSFNDNMWTLQPRGNHKPELSKEEPPQLPINSEGKVLQVTGSTNYGVCLSHTKRKINKLEMVQRRVTQFVKGDYSRTSSVTAMLADLQWNTLQQWRMQSKTVVLYRVVHKLVSIPVKPFLIPKRASRGHNMRYAIPRSTVNAHLYSKFAQVPFISGTSCLPQQSQYRAWRPSGISFHPAPCTCRSTLQF